MFSRLNGLREIRKMAASVIWMKAVDGKFFLKENGPRGFDAREAGSVQGILNGFIVALQQLKKPLSVEKFQLIHKACVQGIRTQNPVSPGTFRDNPVGFEILPEWASVDGLKDLIRQGFFVVPAEAIPGTTKFKIDPSNTLRVEQVEAFKLKMDQKQIKLFYLPPSPTEVADRLAKIVTKFNAAFNFLKKSTEELNPDILLTIIAELIQGLTRTHAFRDGNNRASVNALLNALLANNGFSTGIFYDPNVFEFHTIPELVAIIKEAIKYNKIIVEDPDALLFDFKNSMMTSDLEKYKTMGLYFIREIDRLILEEPGQAFLIKHYTKPANCPSLIFMPTKSKVLVSDIPLNVTPMP